MITVLTIILVLLAVTVHELGHYEAMKRCGVRVKEVALLGFPVKFLPSFSWKRSGTTWSIHPLLLGAYVKPEDDERTNSLSLRDQLYINGAGPLTNIIYTCVLMAIHTLIVGLSAGTLAQVTNMIFLFIGVALALWMTRRYITLFFPLLSIPLVILIISIIFGSSPTQAVEEGSGGPAAIAAFVSQTDTILHALLLAAAISLNLAAINLLPISPLDGGQSIAAVMKTWFGKRYENFFHYLTAPVFLLIILYTLGLDVIRIWNGIW